MAPGAPSHPWQPPTVEVLSPERWLDRFPVKKIKPRTAILGLILLTYIWRFHDIAPGVGALRLSAISTLGSWVFLAIDTNPKRLGSSLGLPYVWAFLAWSIWILVSAQYALDSEVATSYWTGVHYTSATMFLFVMLSLKDLRFVQLAILANVGGAAIVSFFYAKGGYQTWGSPVPQYDVNEFALVLLMTLPFVIFFATSEKNSKIRMGFWALAVFMAVAILMTRSRGAFLTTGIIIGILLIRGRGLSLKARILPPIMLVVGFSFLPADVTDRLSTLFNPSEDYNATDEEGRIEIWKRGLGYLGDNPVFGVGANNFPIAEATLSPRAQAGFVERGFVTHNSFLQVASETGVPGGSLFIFMIVAALWRLRRLSQLYKRRKDPESQNYVVLCDMAQLSLISYCAAGFFLSMGYSVYLFALIAIVAGIELNAPKQTGALIRPQPRRRPHHPLRARRAH